MSAELAQVLENAILNPDPAKRSQAEAQLQGLSKDNFMMYVGLLTQVLADESLKPEVRILAGISVKNELTSKDTKKKAEQAQRWIEMEQAPKSEIKRIALQSLLTENDRVANSAAQLVAAIADIELPRKEWNDLIGIIMQNTKPENPEHVKRASLLTIGYICESADPNDANIVAQSNGILISIVQGAQASEPSKVVRLTALNALVDSLEFIKYNFEREGERHYIMQVVCEATQAEDNELKAAAFGALARIMALYYSHMSVYMEKALYGLTVSGMQSDDERVACMAVEFWSTVCENEIDIAIEKEEYPESTAQLYNFALVAINDIIPTLFQLLKKQSDDPEDDTWNVAMAAGACLQLFAQDTGNYVVQPTLQFVEQNINSSQWRDREAAVMAFGSILDGPDKDQLTLLVQQALGPILRLIEDENLQVKETVAWCIGRIADLIIDAIDDQTHLPLVMQTIFRGLDDHGKVSTNCCWTLINIVEQLNESARDSATSQLSPYYNTLVPLLLKVSGRGDNEHASRAAAYEALSTLVLYSANDCMQYVNAVASEVLERISATVQLQSQVSSADDKANLEELQSNILSLLTNVIRRVGNEVSAVSDSLMELLLKLLQTQQQNSVIEEDVFICISSLASSIGVNFNNYMNAFLPFLTNALNQVSAPVANTAVGLVADISHSLGEHFRQYSDGLMNILGGLLQNPGVRKELKPAVLSAFGDIAAAIGSAFKPYMQVVFTVCKEAQNMEAENNSIEATDYLLSVRESVLDCYVGIVGGVHSANEIFPYASQIFELLNIITTETSLTMSESVTKSAAGMLGDLAEIFVDGQIKQAYAQDWVTSFLKKSRANAYFSDDTQMVIQWARQQQRRQLNL
ncbi:CYFA0S09e00210g1_1 [Cyberlindnera fabianii]|uniref:Importin-95 n=1 Tax=Cyberlindnera fabianii TaxID=36022 RepID=A0A061AX92_CYBFA|nr:Importin subunit beta-1 [Cyberlindnera fabianii]CDR42288.1 CYFA0S09e00210g1_1 [Cyberlindnera fabianii]